MKHIKSLDSLRGVACLSVFLSHMTDWHNRYKYFNVFSAGNEAVILFFVLSGFVLTASYNRCSKFNILAYGVNRLIRIYPAYYFAIFLAILLGINKRIVSDNMSLFYVNTFLLITQSASPNTLDSPSWSLSYEIIISILVLPIIWKIKHDVKIFFALTFILLIFSLFIGYVIHVPILDGFLIPDKLIGIPVYACFFMLGVLSYDYRYLLQRYMNKTAILVSLILYFNFYISLRFGSLIYTALGACGIVIAVAYNPLVRKFMENKILLFYGKISFSFYILHIILIETVPPYVPSFIYPKSAVTFIVATILSYLSYKYIELPFMKMGNFMFGKVARS